MMNSNSPSTLNNRFARLLLGSIIVLIFIVFGLLFSLAFGAVDIPLNEVLNVIQGKGKLVNSQIIIESRLPRAIAAILVLSLIHI